MTTSARYKNSVRLTAYDAAGQTVLEERVSIQAFYEKSHPVLDEPGFRQNRGIVRLHGAVFDLSGAQAEEFDVQFDPTGRVLSDAPAAGVGPFS